MTIDFQSFACGVIFGILLGFFVFQILAAIGRDYDDHIRRR